VSPVSKAPASRKAPKPIKPPERIQTERLVLRPWRPTDAPLLKAVIDGNLEHLRAWMPWAKDEPSPVEVIEQRIEKFDRSFRAGSEWGYAIYSRDESALYGGAGLHPRIGPGGIEIGFWLHKAWTGKGFATEAIKALTEAAFALPTIERVEIRCDPRNTRSAAVAQRAGFRHATTLEKNTLDPGGAPRDTMVWEQTRSRAVAKVEESSAPGRKPSLYWWLLSILILATVIGIALLGKRG
jgi:RimJ/RimL family protein N-acetyltransferase